MGIVHFLKPPRISKINKDIFLDRTLLSLYINSSINAIKGGKRMARKCAICGKKAISGNSITRRGLAKKKGGVGKKTTGIAKRKFQPNLQRKRVIIDGKIRKILVCAKCIKSGKLTFPPIKKK